MPTRTLQAIARLRPLGLTNARFRLLHHLGKSLDEHEKYCREGPEQFTAATNDIVRMRLELVYAALSYERTAGDPPPTEGEWQAVIVLAWNRYPFPPSA